MAGPGSYHDGLRRALIAGRDTLAAGAAPNTPENLRLWLRHPDAIKPGSLMPAMQLSDEDVNAVADYLESLR